MIDPLTKFKQSLLKTVEVNNHKFTFNPFIKLKTVNRIDLLAEGLKAVDGVNLVDFDSIKEKENKEEAIKEEIKSWDSSLTTILFQKLIKLIQEHKEINFAKEKDLRVYWKIRKIFSKEEIDNWTDLDWAWAYENIYQDEIEKDEFDNRALEKRKIWYNHELFFAFRKQKETEKQQKQEEELLLKKLLKEQGVNLPENIELVDAEENDIPMILEEK